MEEVLRNVGYCILRGTYQNIEQCRMLSMAGRGAHSGAYKVLEIACRSSKV